MKHYLAILCAALSLSLVEDRVQRRENTIAPPDSKKTINDPRQRRFVPSEYNRHYYPQPQREKFPITAPEPYSHPENFASPRRHPRRFKEPSVPSMPITPPPRSSPADH